MDKNRLEKLYSKIEDAILADDKEIQNNNMIDALEIVKDELNRPLYRDGHPCEELWLMDVGYETEKTFIRGSLEEQSDFLAELLERMLERFRIITDGGTWMF